MACIKRKKNPDQRILTMLKDLNELCFKKINKINTDNISFYFDYEDFFFLTKELLIFFGRNKFRAAKRELNGCDICESKCKQEVKQISKLDEDKIFEVISGIFGLYKSYFINCPFIQENGKVKLLDGDLIILKKILDKYSFETITELQEKHKEETNKLHSALKLHNVLNQKPIDNDVIKWLKDKFMYYQIFSDKKNIDIVNKLLKHIGVK